ncbi:MAG: hypothetical protein ACRBN8_19050 [Nannocystales bacterium]
MREIWVGIRSEAVLRKSLLPLLALAIASTAASTAEAADSWRIKRQVWADISVEDSQVHGGLFKRSIDFTGGRVATNTGARLLPVCKTADGRISGATPYKSGNRWRMKCMGETYAQGARALKMKSRYSAEPDTITKARGRLPQAAVKVRSGGSLKALCLAKVGGQNVPGVMDIPSVHSDAPMPHCKVWLMGQLTGVARWSIVKHAISIPSSPNTWWNPGQGNSMPEMPTYIMRSGTSPLCRSHELFGAKWPGTLHKSSGPSGMSVYCSFTYLNGSGALKAGKTKSFEVYLASDPDRAAFPKWGSARPSASANYSRGLQISKRNGEWVYMCLQSYGKLGFSTPGSKKCRAANGSTSRERHFKLLER